MMIRKVVRWILRRFAYVRELERISDQHTELVTGKATIHDIALRNGAFTVQVSSQMVHVLAEQMATVLDEYDAPNYVEARLRHRDGRSFVVTVQRCEGKSPHQIRKQLEEEIARLKLSPGVGESDETDQSDAAVV